jgi:hypothetical protein
MANWMMRALVNVVLICPKLAESMLVFGFPKFG